MNIRITDIDGLKPSFTQWDVDRVLYVDGCATQPMLHFWNDTLTRAIVVEPEADGSRWACRVPNTLLQHFMPIAVSVFIQEEDDEGKTVARFVLPVRPKAKPQDYTFEENIGYVNWVEKSEEAQELLDDIEDLRDEIQTAVDTATSASEAAVAAAEDIDETVAAALQAAKDSGDFDGADGQDGQDGAPGPKGDPGEDGVSPRFSSTAITGGHRITVQDAYGDYTFDVMDGATGPAGEDGADGSNAWLIDVQYTNTVGTTIRAKTEHLIGPSNARPMYGDVLFVSDGRFGNIFSPGTRITMATLLGDLHGEPGEDGYSPVVTITEIDGGHRVTITDEDHPQGQSFDVMDGQGGSGSSDYDDLTNKPQIAGVTLSGNKSLADLGIAAASDIPTVPSAYTSTPADLGTASAGSSTSWAKGDHVHKMPSAADVGAYALPSGGIPASDLASAVQTSLGKADTALQTAPVTSVNGQTGAVTVAEPFFVTYSTSDMTTWTCDKTFAQITAAMAAGTQVVLLGNMSGSPLAQGSDILLSTDGTYYYIEFWIRSSINRWYRITHYSDDRILFFERILTYDEVGAVADNQGVSHAGEFLVVGSDGYVTTMSLSTWQGGNY